MALIQLFCGFLQPVAMGSAVVFVLLAVIALRTPRRSPTLINRRNPR